MTAKRLFNTLLGLVAGLLATVTIQAQNFTTLASFNGTDGGNPYLITLVQGFDGNLYGSTLYGGANNKGVVFKLSNGNLTVLHNFSGVSPDGAYANGGLLLSTSGMMYGTTELGGTGSAGIVFRVRTNGAVSTLTSFTGANGMNPDARLIQVGGAFYGTSAAGGTATQGNVFRMTGAGAIVSLYSFTGFPDGAVPRDAVVRGADGNFYGTTLDGGSLSTSGGAIFKMTPAGKESILQSFPGGYQPVAGLIQGPDGSFYGTTLTGGPSNAGTIFKMSADGKTLTTLHNFGQGNKDAAFPYAGLVLATDGFLYGTSSAGVGAAYGYGTIYRISTDGVTYKVLYQFANGTDGFHPTGGLLQATDGNFYGTTLNGVNSSANCPDGGTCGTIFQFSMGLAPFVKTLPGNGRAGARVVILGNNLTGSTAVSFNGTPVAAFVVNATGTAITTNVPAGATTGFVNVTTPSGVLTSNVQFHVP